MKLLRYGNFTDSQSVRKTTLKALDEKREAFAICQYQNSELYLLGGASDAGSTPFNTSARYSIASDTWDKNVPLFVQKRKMHSCCVVDQKIYVFGGVNEQDEKMDSIEMINPSAGDEAWALLKVSALFTPRSRVAVSQLNAKQILIFGG